MTVSTRTSPWRTGSRPSTPAAWSARIDSDLPRPPGRSRLRKNHRVRKRRDFLAVRKEGRTVRDAVLRIAWRRRNGGETRLGLAVSRRAGPAVRRNRIKRIVREAFRLDREALPSGYDLVVMVLDPRRASVLEDVRASLRALLGRIREREGDGRPGRRGP